MIERQPIIATPEGAMGKRRIVALSGIPHARRLIQRLTAGVAPSP